MKMKFSTVGDEHDAMASGLWPGLGGTREA